MKGNWIKLTKEQLEWFWRFKSSISTVEFPNGDIYGTPKPRCECTVRVSGRVINI